MTSDIKIEAGVLEKCPTDAVIAEIPENVKFIADNAFAGCTELKQIISKSPLFVSKSGCLYDAKNKILITTVCGEITVPKENRSIIAAERIVAIGFASPVPAISGADPWIGSYRPQLVLPMDAEARSPIEPVIWDASSDRMSPNILEVRTTSNLDGSRTSCIAALSTSISLNSTSG